MKKVSLKKALEMYGANEIEIHNGYNYRSGFFEKEGQLYYFSTSDLRSSLIEVLIRTAKHRKDYTGGVNTYPLKSFLNERGYELKIARKSCEKTTLVSQKGV